MSDKKLKSNVVEKYLHQILTKAIFHYSLYKDLLNIYDDPTFKPKKEIWAKGSNKFLSLSADPFSLVSKYFSNSHNYEVQLTHKCFLCRNYPPRKEKTLPFCPSFPKLISNLKRKQLWKSVEVHAIYAFLYILCTNKVGLQHVQIYFSSTDNQIHDPIFIAQYLLAPMNTIV